MNIYLYSLWFNFRTSTSSRISTSHNVNKALSKQYFFVKITLKTNTLFHNTMFITLNTLCNTLRTFLILLKINLLLFISLVRNKSTFKRNQNQQTNVLRVLFILYISHKIPDHLLSLKNTDKNIKMNQ